MWFIYLWKFYIKIIQYSWNDLSKNLRDNIDLYYFIISERYFYEYSNRIISFLNLIYFLELYMKNGTIFHEWKKSKLKAFSLKNVTSLALKNVYKLRNNFKTEYITKYKYLRKQMCKLATMVLVASEFVKMRGN